MSVLHIASAVSLRTLRASGPKRASIALAALVSVAVFSTTLATPQPPAAAAAAKTSAPQDQAPLSTDAPEQDPLTVPQGDAKGSPLPTGADRSDESTKSRTLSDAQRNSGRGVLIGRTESADVYRLPNGQTMAEQHAQPINKRDKAGNWSKIDTRLRDVSAEKTGRPGRFQRFASQDHCSRADPGHI